MMFIDSSLKKWNRSGHFQSSQTRYVAWPFHRQHDLIVVINGSEQTEDWSSPTKSNFSPTNRETRRFKEISRVDMRFLFTSEAH